MQLINRFLKSRFGLLVLGFGLVVSPGLVPEGVKAQIQGQNQTTESSSGSVAGASLDGNQSGASVVIQEGDHEGPKPFHFGAGFNFSIGQPAPNMPSGTPGASIPLPGGSEIRPGLVTETSSGWFGLNAQGTQYFELDNAGQITLVSSYEAHEMLYSFVAGTEPGSDLRLTAVRMSIMYMAMDGTLSHQAYTGFESLINEVDPDAPEVSLFMRWMLALVRAQNLSVELEDGAAAEAADLLLQ